MGPLLAATLSVSPVLIHLSAATPTDLVALTNAGSDPVRVQISVLAWSEGPDGQIVLEPTSELEAFPPLLQLAPGQKRNIRVGVAHAGKSPASERTWRLIVEELPPPPSGKKAVEIPTASRLSMPVFFAPETSVVRATVTEVGLRAGRLSFALANSGTVHVRPRSVGVRAADAAGVTVFEKKWDGWYLLAGGVRKYELPVAAADCARIANVVVEAPGEEWSVSTSWRPPAGGCGP
jgi:fimbrial chaperone protein